MHIFAHNNLRIKLQFVMFYSFPCRKRYVLFSFASFFNKTIRNLDRDKYFTKHNSVHCSHATTSMCDSVNFLSVTKTLCFNGNFQTCYKL